MRGFGPGYAAGHGPTAGWSRVGAAVIVALVVALRSIGDRPGSSASSGQSIAAHLAPGTCASGAPERTPGPSPGSAAQAWDSPGRKAPAKSLAQRRPDAGTEPATDPPRDTRPTPKPTPRPTPKPGRDPAPGNCEILPASNQWNARVDSRRSPASFAALTNGDRLERGLYPDFDTSPGDGMHQDTSWAAPPPARPRPSSTAPVGPCRLPIPTNPKIEGGSDRHLPMSSTRVACCPSSSCSIRPSERSLARAAASRQPGASPRMRSGRPADECRLPPACRSSRTWPATTRWRPASSVMRCASPRRRAARAMFRPATRPAAAVQRRAADRPAGAAQASFDISRLLGPDPVILQALKTYGMILAEQRLAVVHQRFVQPTLGRRRAAQPEPGQGLRFRGGRHLGPVAPRRSGAGAVRLCRGSPGPDPPRRRSWVPAAG